MKKIVIFGAAGQAKVALEAIAHAGVFEVLGLISAHAPTLALTSQVIGGDADVVDLWRRLGPFDAHIAIGDGALRRRIAERMQQALPELAFPAIVHPLAKLAKSARIGPGTLVAIGATICADAAIGPHALINTNASVDHDCVIGAYASIAPGATLGGTVQVGDEAFIGIGAAILPNITIGPGAIVGAGAVVVRDVAAATTVVGVPAKNV